jgi:hypothetical protein
MKVRINNIGATRVAEYKLSIVKYHPNRYYGELENYLKDGWKDRGSDIYCNNISINKKCFKYNESNYTIAYLRYDSKENCTRLESVGDTLLYIEEEERKDFFEVYKIADRMLMEQVDRDELADFGLALT